MARVARSAWRVWFRSLRGDEQAVIVHPEIPIYPQVFGEAWEALIEAGHADSTRRGWWLDRWQLLVPWVDEPDSRRWRLRRWWRARRA